MRGCFRVSQLGTDVSGIVARQFGAVGRCVSSADTSLSLSLSLSCPSSTPRLTAPSRRFSHLLARHGSPRPAPCSKLPCHARNDVRRPQAVTRDRSLAYTLTIGRQAHCEGTCRAPGGVAEIKSASSLQHAVISRAPGGVAGSPHTSFLPPASVSRGRGGVAEIKSVSSLPRALVSRGRGSVTGSPHASSLQHSLVQRVCSSVVAIALIVVSVFEEAPVRAPTRAGSDIERRGFNSRPRRSACFRLSGVCDAG